MTSSLHSCWALSRDSNQMCSLQGTPGEISEREPGNVFEVFVQLEPEATNSVFPHRSLDRCSSKPKEIGSCRQVIANVPFIKTLSMQYMENHQVSWHHTKFGF